MIQTFPDADALMRGTAKVFVDQARRAVSTRERFSVALAGGNTPKRVYELLAGEPYCSQIDWSHVHVFWCDERCVPPDDARSNYFMTRKALLDHVPIPAGNVHRIRGEKCPAAAATDYDTVLAHHFGAEPVRFDLVLLGLGTNGHTASLFPKTPVLKERTRRAAEVYVAELDMWRVTLTVPVLNAAGVVAFLVSGPNKADILRQVIFGPRDSDRLPAQLIQPTANEIAWLVDRTAASRLPVHTERATRTTSNHTDEDRDT